MLEAKLVRVYDMTLSNKVACKCPFHYEETGSCIVKEMSEKFTCLGCGKKGKAILVREVLTEDKPYKEFRLEYEYSHNELH